MKKITLSKDTFGEYFTDSFKQLAFINSNAQFNDDSLYIDENFVHLTKEVDFGFKPSISIEDIVLMKNNPNMSAMFTTEQYESILNFLSGGIE